MSGADGWSLRGLLREIGRRWLLALAVPGSLAVALGILDVAYGRPHVPLPVRAPKFVALQKVLPPIEPVIINRTSADDPHKAPRRTASNHWAIVPASKAEQRWLDDVLDDNGLPIHLQRVIIRDCRRCNAQFAGASVARGLGDAAPPPRREPNRAIASAEPELITVSTPQTDR